MNHSPMLNKDADVGYTYIYIYKHNEKFVYTGQTKHSIYGRYEQHLYNDAYKFKKGYITEIIFFEIENKYKDYAEGYIGRSINTLAKNTLQGKLPNPCNCECDTDTHRELSKIVRYLYKGIPSGSKRRFCPLTSVIL